MKKLVVALAALAMSMPALAQDKAKIGIGISIVPLEKAGNSPTVELYLPMQLTPQIRLEPSVGIFTNNTNAVDTRDVTLGLGVFFTQSVAQPVDMYFGGRVKLNFAEDDPGDSGIDFVLAGALGGEYYLVPKFSVGLEGQLGFFSNSNVSGDNSGLFTTGLAFLRMYF